MSNLIPEKILLTQITGQRYWSPDRKSQGTSGFLFVRSLRFTFRHFVLGHFLYCFFSLWLKLTSRPWPESAWLNLFCPKF